MKINGSEVILDIEGNPIKETRQVVVKGPGGPQLAEEDTDELQTVGKLARRCLLTDFRDDDQNAEDKVKRFEIAMKVVVNGEFELKSDEAALIKKRAGKLYSTTVAARMAQAMDRS